MASSEKGAGGTDALGPLGDNSSLWQRHTVSSTDTMAHLALKHETTIGNICRANRMHPQDVLQMHRQIWLPLQNFLRIQTPLETPAGNRRTSRLGVASIIEYASNSRLPPHFYRQSAPNVDDFAEESDPLLITTRVLGPKV